MIDEAKHKLTAAAETATQTYYVKVLENTHVCAGLTLPDYVNGDIRTLLESTTSGTASRCVSQQSFYT